MENQCLGLAEALGVAPQIKRIRLRAPWEWLPPRLGIFINPLAGLDGRFDMLAPPWPDLLIATGRRTVAVSAMIRRLNGRTVTVQIQNPHFPASAFDLVVTPAHDRLRGANVITTAGALHRVTRSRLDNAANEFRRHLAHLPRPLVAVLIGGANSAYRMDPHIIARLTDGLRELAKTMGCSFAVTPSRRTGEDNIAALREGLVHTPHMLWEGEGPNPYFGYLGLADGVIVTSDSVNMVSEACASQKPVYVYDLPGGSAKFNSFHAAMRERGAVRPFIAGQTRLLESWTLPAIDDTAKVVRAVKRLLILQNN
ncbi:MAG: mitochondrial fission ELM1 family protein [Alphaproteobacteria bacterium]